MSKHKQHEQPTWSLPPEIEEIAAREMFDGSNSLAVAGQIAMAGHVRKLYAHLPGALSGEDAHDIHQARVATRRLRASLTATSAAYDAKVVRDLSQRLRKLARVLGAVRDRDVLLIRLQRDAETDASRQLQTAIDQLRRERAAAHAELAAELGRKRTTRLLRDLQHFLVAPLDTVQADTQGLPLLVRHHLGSAIWHEYEAVRRFETFMPDAGSEGLHQLRIACKHMRYTLELFEPALGEDVRGVIKQVTAMQEHLGNVHDADVAIAYLHELRPLLEDHDQQNGHYGSDHTHGDPQPSAIDPAFAQAESQDGITQYIAVRTAEQAATRAEVADLWRTLNSATLRRKLARAIADV